MLTRYWFLWENINYGYNPKRINEIDVFHAYLNKKNSFFALLIKETLKANY